MTHFQKDIFNVPPPGIPKPAKKSDWVSRLDLGSFPIVIGLLIIWGIFQMANDKFLSPVNLTNLMFQISALGTIAVGAVLVLLIGEVDLSAGIVSGLSAAVMAVLNVKAGFPGPVAVLVGLLSGLLIGLFHGFWITRFRIPSFIVTLAGQIGWTGALLSVLGNTGTVNLRDPFILGLAGTFLKRDVPNGEVWGWALGGVFAAGFVINLVLERRRRLKAGLMVNSVNNILFKSLVISAIVFGALFIMNADRGIPSSLIFFIGSVIFMDFLTKRTVFGRHIYAVGGNAEAAYRASINVNVVRIAVFGLASTLAAFGGILAASRLLAVNQSSGGSDLLLNVIAAAVIGGTSLFGGRGSAWSALLGALIIGSISNGMDLLALPSPIKVMITGAVLLSAVTIESISRHRREAVGR